MGGIWLFTGILYIFTGIGYCCENGCCDGNCCNEVNGTIVGVTSFAVSAVTIWASWKVFGKSLHLLILWCRAGGRSNEVVIICLILTPWSNRINWSGKIWGANWAGLAVLQGPSWQSSGYFELTDRLAYAELDFVWRYLYSVYSLGLRIWVSSTSSIGWPQQPPNRKGSICQLKFVFLIVNSTNKDRYWSFSCHWWSNHQNEEVFWGCWGQWGFRGCWSLWGSRKSLLRTSESFLTLNSLIWGQK